MDIKQRLQQVLDDVAKDGGSFVDVPTLCRDALAEIERLENVTRSWPAPAITQEEVRLVVREELTRWTRQLAAKIREFTAKGIF